MGSLSLGRVRCLDETRQRTEAGAYNRGALLRVTGAGRLVVVLDPLAIPGPGDYLQAGMTAANRARREA